MDIYSSSLKLFITDDPNRLRTKQGESADYVILVHRNGSLEYLKNRDGKISDALSPILKYAVANLLKKKKESNQPTKSRFERSILKDADHIVNSDRPDRYGRIEESFSKVAAMATLMLTEKEKTCGKITAQMAIKVMKAVKLVRDTYSPDNVDHLKDECGYTELLDQLRQLGIE